MSDTLIASSSGVEAVRIFEVLFPETVRLAAPSPWIQSGSSTVGSWELSVMALPLRLLWKTILSWSVASSSALAASIASRRVQAPTVQPPLGAGSSSRSTVKVSTVAWALGAAARAEASPSPVLAIRRRLVPVRLAASFRRWSRLRRCRALSWPPHLDAGRDPQPMRSPGQGQSPEIGCA
jgi:hypothetical protein